jgi:uncharacterized protein YdaU (DUF1376 family)
MSKRAWMPLYVGDYLADTGHLNTTQHGAYLLLMMHYWKKGELPDDDKQLAAIAKLPLRLWLDSKETLQAFFHDGWRHGRIDEELARMQEKTNRRAAAGQKGGLRSAMNRMLLQDAASRSNATATLNHSHSPSKITTTVSEERKGLGGEREGKSQIPISTELAASLSRFRQ